MDCCLECVGIGCVWELFGYFDDGYGLCWYRGISYWYVFCVGVVVLCVFFLYGVLCCVWLLKCFVLLLVLMMCCRSVFGW